VERVGFVEGVAWNRGRPAELAPAAERVGAVADVLALLSGA
jgi:hypothetical protein